MAEKITKKFYQMDQKARLRFLANNSNLNAEELEILKSLVSLTFQDADHMIENAVGLYALPLGIAQNFMINGRNVLIPMVIEEPSVVAGASFMAKLALSSGGFFTNSTAPEMIGQIQLLDIKHLEKACEIIKNHKEELLNSLKDLDPILHKLGGGPRDLEVRIIDQSLIGPFIVLHLIYDVRDVMGANAVNTAVEFLAPKVESLTGGRVHLRILSNLADRRLSTATVTIKTQALAFDDFPGEKVRDGIIEAWAFAATDPYRAATHNKGIMNGVDAVVIATGNDWRAVEAGAHAFAARSGQYTSLSQWGKNENNDLVGSLTMPMAVGIAGGATKVHPGARVCVKLMGLSSASELAEIITAVGLAQNLAALRALATEGIQKGHMALHARQVAIAAGAKGDLIDKLADQLIVEKNIRIDRAEAILKDRRGL